MILYTDIEPFCCEVLRARVADGGLDQGDVWERDVRTLTAEELKPYTQVHLFCGIGASPLGLKWAGWPDDFSIVTGGFPCQDISTAGKGAGIDGARSGLWKEMHRVIDIVRPAWVIAENVPALRTRGIDRVLGDLERIGYECWPLVVGADDVGAPHRRKRVWIVGRLADTNRRLSTNGNTGRVGNTQCSKESGKSKLGSASSSVDGRSWSLAEPERDGCGSGGGIVGDESGARIGRGESARGVQLADSPRGGLRADGSTLGDADIGDADVGDAGGSGREERDASRFSNPTRFRGWPVAPGQRQHEWEAPRLIERAMGVAADGVPGRLARSWNRKALKALGNAQVPQVVELIARAILQTESSHA